MGLVRLAVYDADGAPAAGEGSPAYSDLDRFPDAPARIAEHLPHVKLIYTVRHPVRRAESHWIHLRTFHSPTAKTTRHALETYPEIIGCSRYFRQISAYRENFPDDRIHVVFLEDFKADPDRELRRIFGFLGVAEGVPLDSPGMARNVATNGKVVDTPLLMKLRTLKTHRMLRRLLPLRCREMLRTKFFRRKLSERPEFDAEDARYVRDRVAEDAAHFLEYCGKRAGFWELEKQ